MSTTGILRIEDATPFHASVDWKMGVLALAAAAGIVWGFGLRLDFDTSAPEFNPAVFVPVLLAAYGALQLIRFLRAGAVGRRFGATVFEMQGTRLFAGDTLRGHVRTARHLPASDGFRLRVRGIESRRIHDTAGAGWRDQDAILWEGEHTVHAADTANGGIAVEFVIPADAGAGAKGGPVRWTLEAMASVDGAPFSALFGLPMWAGDRRTHEDGLDAIDEDERSS